jgi:hypothetical protein
VATAHPGVALSPRLPQRRDLLTRENRSWVEQAALPDTAREQVTVALAMIDALDVQLAPIDRELRAYARRQVGCRAVMGLRVWDQVPASDHAGRPTLLVVNRVGYAAPGRPLGGR